MARWIPDGSSGFTVDGNVVTYKDEEGVDNIFNCLWEDGEGVSSGSHYWKIHFETLEDGAGVGLTSKDRFKKGYACRAIEYLGNLSDASCLLVGNFGPSPSAGDIIGILASFENDRLKVYIDVNGRSLGMAFDVPASIFKSVYPMVSFHKSGSATCRKETDVPEITTRAPTTFTDIEGDWQLESIDENGTVTTDLECQPTTKLKKKEANKYSWFARIVNNLSTSLWKEDGNWKTSGVVSTLMMGPPEWMAVENQVTKLMEKVKVLEIETNGNLTIKSDTTSTSWTRYDSTPSGYVGNPFD